MVIEAAKVLNENDNIIDSLNGWSARRVHDLFANSGSSIISKDFIKGFTVQSANKLYEFTLLKKRYFEEELTAIGMILYLGKDINKRLGTE